MAMSVNLGTAAGFGVLAGSAITFAGSGPTTVNGDIGSFPTASITGVENLILAGGGMNHGGDAVTQSAKNALLIAYNDAFGRSATTSYGAIYDLGGQTLTQGVYKDPTSFGITGTLTLDAQGDADAVWIFQAGTTLTAESGSKVNLINGAQAGNIYWQVGSSATLKTDAYFVGSLLAMESITLVNGATVDGRVLALNGAVTMDHNTILVPEASALQLLVIGLAAVAALRRRTAPLT